MMNISFDWDSTLWDNELDSFKFPALMLLKVFLDRGDRVIITTSRISKWIPEVKDALQREGISIGVFSAPNIPNASGDEGLSKSDILSREKMEIHFDDMPDHEDLKVAKELGIRILLS